MESNNISGEFSEELCLLSNLATLMIYENDMHGNIPFKIENLTKISFLHLGANNFTGKIPSSIGNLSNLKYLYLYGNNFNGEFPQDFSNLENIQTLFLSYNSFSSIPDLTHFNFRLDHEFHGLTLESNNFTFASLEPNASILPDEITRYSPQDDIQVTANSFIAKAGSSFSLDMTELTTVDLGGENNRYRWLKDNNAITQNSESPVWQKSALDASDAGEYICEITNINVPDLALKSLPITLTVVSPPAVQDVNVLYGTENPLLAATGENIKWYADSLLTESLVSGSNLSASESEIGEYIFYATQTIEGVESDPAPARLIISPLEGSISGSGELCINSPDSEYETNLTAANSYEWTLNPSEAGAITAKGQKATINWNDSFAGDVEIQVKGIYDDEIELDADPLSVKIHQKPSPEILGVDKVCIEQLGELYRVEGAENHTYDWTVNGGIIKTGQETNQITIDWGASAGDATVSLTESVNGLDGCSSQASKYVIIRPDLAPEDPPDIHLKGGFILICADSGLYP